MKSLLAKLEGVDQTIGQITGGMVAHLQPISGEVPVVQVSIEGRQELPIFVTTSDAQLLCMCYLWADDEIRPEKRAELVQTLLDLNPSVPLSSFGRVGDRYVLFGALSRHARVQEIAEEIVVLSDNALDALDALSDFLI